MIYTKEKFKELWEANSCGSGITYGDIADCAKAWGISECPKIRTIDEIAYKVLKAAQVNDAEEYNPNPAPMKRAEIGCGYCIHEVVCEKRKNRTITTRELAKECGNFVHYKVLDESTDWEQRRYEVARTMLPTMFELAMNEKKEMNGCGFVDPKNICKAAILYADELINQLKPKGGFQD